MITGIVLTRDAEASLATCLKSLTWCDEILLADDSSKDATREIAEKFHTRTLKVPNGESFSEKRNYALKHAKHTWVLFVDADEYVSGELQKEILEKVTESTYDGFFIQRVDNLWGKMLLHGETGNMALMRLGKKDSGLWTGFVHEVWDIHGRVGRLKQQLIHYPHENIESFIQKINFYTTLRAKELFSEHNHVSILAIVFFPLGKFLYNYLIKFGFLDGIPGLMHAIVMAFHSFLVRAKLWELQKNK